MTRPRLLWTLCVVSLLGLSACDDESTDTTTTTDTSGAADAADTSTADQTPEDATTQDASTGTDTAQTSEDATTQDAPDDAPDADTPRVCDFPAPSMAAEAATLAANPARCGQAPYTWRSDVSEMGELTGYGARINFTAEAINTAAAQNGITLPRPAAHDVKVIQYSYKTQAKGQVIEATSLAAFPSDLGPDDPPLPILVVLHGTAGFNDACAPSSTLDAQAFGALFASFGYFVVGPDYIGLKGLGDPTGYMHPYLVGEPTAMASLDAIRAAGHLPFDRRGDTCAGNQILVLGGSQGGHAALWLDRLAPYYAPELDILGIVATVPPADVLAQAERALTTPVSATANTIAMLATQSDWYESRANLSEVFVSPLDVDVPNALSTSCSPGDLLDSVTTLEEVFQPAILDATAAGTLADFSPWGCVFAENGLVTTSIPRHPAARPDSYGILYILGEQDDLVNTPIERTSFQTLCAEQSMPLQYLECAGASHTRATVWAVPEILAFIDARLAGQPMDTNAMCQLSAPVRCQGTPSDVP